MRFAKATKAGATASVFLALMISTATLRAVAQTETVLYNFCSQANCADGSDPMAGLIMDAENNFYGTTFSGGTNGLGTVFKLTPAGAESVLYSFCSQANCADGRGPGGGLIMDAEGNLYSTTSQDGANGNGGTVFKLTPSGTLNVLYSFCSKLNCTDGNFPLAGLVMDPKGNLFGTTLNGGTHGAHQAGDGTIFKVAVTGIESVVHSFCPQQGCPDGEWPYAGLFRDAEGNLYGTVYRGGVNNAGAVFKLTRKVNGGFTQSVIYSFCAQANCTDGNAPRAGLITDAQGNLYGTTTVGGVNNGGTVFELTSSGTESVLYNFCSKPKCADGDYLLAGVIIDTKGNLYGTTNLGGAHNQGTVFKLTPTGEETVLHSFCSKSNCTDGARPDGVLIMDTAGNLYGTTEIGGASNQGVVFKVTP